MTNKNYALAIHGGAGTISKTVMTPDKERAYIEALENILIKGEQSLKAGKSAVDVAVQAVEMLEDCSLFNAGKGAVFTNHEEHELDASIMDGQTLKAGAVAQARHVKNPIQAARKVMEDNRYVFLSGEAVDNFARECGLKTVPQSYYSTAERYEQLVKVKALGGMRFILDHDAESLAGGEPINELKKFGTVGAVVKDIYGNLAAANSTGGLTNKLPGRVGDSAVIGAGCYANNATAAIATTGTGETFIRSVFAYDLSAMMEYAGMNLIDAGNAVLKKQEAFEGKGGFIAIDSTGQIIMPFNTEGMYRGSVSSNAPLTALIYKEK